MKNRTWILLGAVLMLMPAAWARTPQAAKADLAVVAQAPAAQDDSIPALPVHRPKGAPASDEDRISREVRHELVMQPYYSLWDWLAFRVHGNTVELLGYTNTVGLKHDALASVKHIEGVEQVIDHIVELPPSPMDDQIRRATARAIFGWGSLSRYSWSAVPSVHIVVSGGRVRLEGIVDSQADKDAAGIRANGVNGVFQVTNNLRVVKP